MSSEPYKPLGTDFRCEFPSAVAVTTSTDLLVAVGHQVLLYKISDAKFYLFCGSSETGYEDKDRFDSKFGSIRGLAISPSGELLISDYGNNRIRIVKVNGVVETFAGNGDFGAQNGPKMDCSFDGPSALCLSPSGELLIADRGNHVIRSLSMHTGEVSTFLGSGKSGRTAGWNENAYLNRPRALRLGTAGQIYVGNRRLGDSSDALFSIHSDGRLALENTYPISQDFKEIVDIFPSFDKDRVLVVAYEGSGNYVVYYYHYSDSHLLPERFTLDRDKKIGLAQLERYLLLASTSLILKNKKSFRVVIEGDDRYIPQHLFMVAKTPGMKVKDVMALIDPSAHFAEPFTGMVLVGPNGQALSGREKMSDSLSAFECGGGGAGSSRSDQHITTRGAHLPMIPPTYIIARPLVSCQVHFWKFGKSKTTKYLIEGGFTIQKLMSRIEDDSTIGLPIHLQALIRTKSPDPPSCHAEKMTEVPEYTFNLFDNRPFPISIQYEEKSYVTLVHASTLIDHLEFHAMEQFKVPERCRILVNNQALYTLSYIGECPILENSIISFQKRSKTTYTFVKTLTGKCVTLDGLEPQDHVIDLQKEYMHKEGIPVDQQRPIFAGKALLPMMTLGECGLADQSTVHLVLRLRG